MEKLEEILEVQSALEGSDCAVVRPEGELSAADLRAIAQHCFRQAQEGRLRVVLDLEGVHHLDYRGVGALHAARQLLVRSGGDLKLAGLSPYLGAILRAAGAHGQFDCFATAEEARADFDRGELDWRRW